MPHFCLFVLFFLAVVPVTDVTTPVVPWDVMEIKHIWNDIPVNWETLGHPSAGSTIDLNIVLQPDRESALIDAVSEISKPSHSRYRAFLSREEIDELVRPSLDTVELVRAWLVHAGIQSSSISKTHGGTWLTVSDLPVTQASQLLGASYQLYRNMKTNETIIRTISYSVPVMLHGHVRTVMPTTHFSCMEVTVQTPHMRSFGPAPAQMQGASGKLGTIQVRQPPPEPLIVKPGNLRWLYGTDQYVPVAFRSGQNSLAVVGDRLPIQPDLEAFMDKYQEENAGGAGFNIENVDDIPLNLGELPSEISNVAVQYATAMAYPTPLFVFRIARTIEAFFQLLNFLFGMQPVPRVISMSFNYFLENQFSPGDADFICFLFLQLGGRGASVLVASGDNGVGPENCQGFHVGFPSSCPWVTSVGGTQNPDREVATPLSGGGFSKYFPIPTYQEDAVNGFLHDAGRPHLGHYNTEGRGYPDISSQAFGCSIYLNGVLSDVSSTACAVSTAAGIISLLNDYMIRNDQRGNSTTRPRLVSSIPGCTAMKSSVSRASMTSQRVQTQAEALLDSQPGMDGIPSRVLGR